MPEGWGERPEEPEFPAWAGWLWECWRDLDNERPMLAVGGMGAPPVPGAIPWSAVDRWASRHEVEGEDFAFLLRAIRLMDSILLDHLSTKGA